MFLRFFGFFIVFVFGLSNETCLKSEVRTLLILALIWFQSANRMFCMLIFVFEVNYIWLLINLKFVAGVVGGES